MSEADKKKAGLNMLEVLSDITFDKKGIVNEDNAKQYATRMINQGLSQHIDTVMFAVEMNKHPFIDPLLHYKYMFNAISRKKRYGKWAKKHESETEKLEILKTVYQISEREARLLLPCLTVRK